MYSIYHLFVSLKDDKLIKIIRMENVLYFWAPKEDIKKKVAFYKLFPCDFCG